MDRYKATHCRKGHEFTPENTIIHHNRRRCRACKRHADKLYDIYKRKPYVYKRGPNSKHLRKVYAVVAQQVEAEACLPHQ